MCSGAAAWYSTQHRKHRPFLAGGRLVDGGMRRETITSLLNYRGGQKPEAIAVQQNSELAVSLSLLSLGCQSYAVLVVVVC